MDLDGIRLILTRDEVQLSSRFRHRRSGAERILRLRLADELGTNVSLSSRELDFDRLRPVALQPANASLLPNSIFLTGLLMSANRPNRAVVTTDLVGLARRLKTTSLTSLPPYDSPRRNEQETGNQVHIHGGGDAGEGINWR